MKDINCISVEKPSEDFICRKAVPITTTIPFNIHQDIKKSHMSWNSLILRGWEATKGFEKLTSTVKVQEEDMSLIQRKSQRMQEVIFDLNDKIEALTKELKDVKK